ncbi:MAG: hypothetical protein ACK2UW_22025 [Anaerolineales bacterium]
MTTCPYCGTSYVTFRSNCQNCGAPLPPPDTDLYASLEDDQIPTPPLPPRPISDRYAWRLLLTDGMAIIGGVFALLGLIFGVIGFALTIGVVTAFVGIPFALIGLVFLGVGGGLLTSRYQYASRVVRVLREGTAAVGRIVNVAENYSVQVNNRHPWAIEYQFQVNGREVTGHVSTLTPPGSSIQPGRRACVLYLPEKPEINSLYPHP